MTSSYDFSHYHYSKRYCRHLGHPVYTYIVFLAALAIAISFCIPADNRLQSRSPVLWRRFAWFMRSRLNIYKYRLYINITRPTPKHPFAKYNYDIRASRVGGSQSRADLVGNARVARRIRDALCAAVASLSHVVRARTSVLYSFQCIALVCILYICV